LTIFFHLAGLHPQASHPPSAEAPLVSIHAPLSKNKLPDLPWRAVGLQPGGVGLGEGVVYGPEELGPRSRTHPRARWSSSLAAIAHMGWARRR